jgi:protease-4
MTFPNDVEMLLEKMRQRRIIMIWRSIAIAVGVFIVLNLLSGDDISTKSHIVRYNIDGIISSEIGYEHHLKEIQEDENVEAVILRINSPGGEAAASELLYRSIKRLAEVKPVVAVMGNYAASGGYITAIAADRIFTMETTITASIGMVMFSSEITKLADKVGISFTTVRSGDLKSQPSGYEEMNPKTLEYLEGIVKSGKDWFLELVLENRDISDKHLQMISDGRVLLGKTAVDYGLADSIGDELDALNWLVTERGIDDNLEVLTWMSEKTLEDFFAENLRGALSSTMGKVLHSILPASGSAHSSSEFLSLSKF